MKIWQIAAVSVAAGITLPAIAQMGSSPTTRAGVEAQVKDRLGKFDANKDGTVSTDELKAFAESRAKAGADEQFAAMDADKNGSVSRAEFDAWRAKRGDRMVRVERYGGPDGMPWPEGRMMPPMPHTPPPTGAAPPPPKDGKPIVHREIRIMTSGDGMAPMMWHGDGKGIVIADAVKKALERFDAADTNKDGTLTPEERKAAREARRAKWKAS